MLKQVRPSVPRPFDIWLLNNHKSRILPTQRPSCRRLARGSGKQTEKLWFPMIKLQVDNYLLQDLLLSSTRILQHSRRKKNHLNQATDSRLHYSHDQKYRHRGYSRAATGVMPSQIRVPSSSVTPSSQTVIKSIPGEFSHFRSARATSTQAGQSSRPNGGQLLLALCRQGAPFQEIPTNYVKEIQSGEF